MCGRFVASTPVSALAERFLAAAPAGLPAEPPAGAPRYNVAPTDDVLVVAGARGGSRRLGTLSWGLLPRWAADPAGAKRLVNLRSETVPDRPGFREALERRRCIVPADGFYEWRPLGDGRRRQPFLIRARDGAPLALAGLWDVWRPAADPDRPPLKTCTVLTTGPNAVVAPLHDRMPVILPPDAWDLWLDPDVTDLGALVPLLRPCDDDVLERWPVGTAVNSVANDGPHLVDPVPEVEPAPPAAGLFG